MASSTVRSLFFFLAIFSTPDLCFWESTWCLIMLAFSESSSRKALQNNLLFDFLNGSSLNSLILVSTKFVYNVVDFLLTFPGPRPLSPFFLFEETTRLLARSEAFGLLNWDKASGVSRVEAPSTSSDRCEPVKSTFIELLAAILSWELTELSNLA